MAVSDGRGLGDRRLSPMCAPDFYGLRPGYGCLTCPLPSCTGCVKIMPTREEAAMLQCGGAGSGAKEKPALAATSASDKQNTL